MNDTFSNYHPAVNFIWFFIVIALSLALLHPVTLSLSLICALCYAALLSGGRFFKTALRFLLPLMLLTALVNPLFNHAGATLLLWLPDGNPLTAEAVFYGLAAAGMLAAVITWFFCFNRVISSDKLVWLFGRVLPALSLVLSMTLRFVPLFTARMKAVSGAQKALGRPPSSAKLIGKIKGSLKVFSIVVTWSLESAIETADSMKSRGYGLPGRTAFSLFRFEKRDALALIFILFCGAYVFAAVIGGGVFWRYFPDITGSLGSPYAVSVFFVWLALCAMPIILRLWEGQKWHYLKSVI